MTSTFRRAAAWLAVLTLAYLLVPAAHAGDRYALLVGVKNYNKNELHNLNYSENDVTELAVILREGGYKRVVLMTQSEANSQGDNDLEPTSSNIRAQLKGLLDDRKPDDTVLVAFSGHGVQLKGKKEHYFCPMDAKLASAGTLISLPEVYEQLGACKAGAKVMLVDACRNDPQAGLSKSGDRPEIELPSDTRPQATPAPGGVAVVFSCSEAERSFESEKLKHGIFFNFVIEGLKGKAANDKGEVGLSGLVQYVTDQMPDQVKADVGPDKRQVPQVVNNLTGSLTLLTIKVTINPPSGDGGEKKAVRVAIDKGREHLDKHEYDQARVSFSVALELDPKSAEAYVCRARALDDLNEYDEALEDCNKAVALDPKSALARAYRSEVYTDKGDFDKALEEADRAVELDSKSAWAFRSRGYARQAKGDIDRAIADYSEAIRLDPQFAVAFNDRGCVYAAKGAFDKAMADYDEAIRLDPKYAPYYHDRGNTLYDKKEDDKAIADYTEAIRLDPKYARAFGSRGHCWLDKQEYDKAIADLDEAIRLEPKFADAFFGRGLAWYDKKETDKAIADYNEVIRLEPKFADAFYCRGLALYDKQEYDKAIADLDEAIRLEPKFALAFNNRALAYEAKGDKDNAAADRAKAKELQNAGK